MSVAAATDTIYVFQGEREGHDLDDQCMKAAIASFALLGEPNDAQGGPRIQFQLHPLTKPVVYKNRRGETKPFPEGIDVEGLVAKLAAVSVAKHLHNAGCVGKDVLSYQFRRGDTASVKKEGNCIVQVNPSDIVAIPLTQNVKTIYHPVEFIQLLSSGIISRTYAYLHQRKLCFYLNDNKPDTIAKINEVLIKFFPKVNP